MPRAVGDSRTYPLTLVNLSGSPIGVQIDVPSVTTILKALPKELAWWAYKIGLLEGRRLGVGEMGDPTITSDDDFYEKVKELGRGEEPTARTPNNVKEAGGDRGTFVHDIAEQVFRDNAWPHPDLVPEDFKGFVHALGRWHKRDIEGKGFEVIAIEQPLVSISRYPYIFAGTVDLILKDTNGMYHVIDFKTSKGIYESHLLQSTAYAYAAVERGLIPEGAMVNPLVVRFAPDGKFQTKSSSCDIQDFVSVYKVYLWLCQQGWSPS